MTGSGLRALSVILSGSLLSGCQIFCVYDCYAGEPPPRPVNARTTVVVVPATADGHIGAVAVGKEGKTVLNRAYAAARIGPDGGTEEFTSSAEEVQAIFADARAAAPRPPVSFTVYFDTGEDSISQSSMGVLDQLRAEMAQRGNSEITVIGHTDRVGTMDNNDFLSGKRAARVREQLIEFGIPANLVSTAARGEREPVVATADEVSEPRNRRVEINIR